MGERVDQVDVNDTMLSTNTLNVKDEQREEDSFIDDKVYISETAISTDNAELQDHIWHDNIKQYEESTCLDNIKTELVSFEGTRVENYNVQVGEGVSTDDIKIEFYNGQLFSECYDNSCCFCSYCWHCFRIRKLLVETTPLEVSVCDIYCEHCEAYYVDYCIECGMLVHILNKYALNNADRGAPEDIPNDILEIQNCFGQTGIYALRIIPAGVTFGPFTGLSTTECRWEKKGEKFVLDKNKSEYLNWMQYINPTTNTCDGNLHVFQSEDKIYYQSSRQVQAGDELLVYFGEEYGNSPNKIIKVDFVTIIKDTGKDVFACTFCCLGFSCISHLAKHKTICVADAAAKFSVEELVQCPICKIHLDSKEYFQHHMAFCCERNARKCILSTPPVNKTTTALNGRKRCPHQIYKCEKCKYRTKYQADLKQHSTAHYGIKIYKCGTCNRSFKTKNALMLHVANTHAYVGGKDNQEYSTTDYRNTHVNAETRTSRDQKKTFKCSLCVFRANYKQTLRIHIKTKHLNEFDYKCDSCEYGANKKTDLKRHIKSKHLMLFDFECDKCEYRTNHKQHLIVHVKSKHLMQFDFKCKKCEFGTNIKIDLNRHIKTKHLKKFDYKCDQCEYRTNKKYCLECHVKNKHSLKFYNKCDNCEFGTVNKTDLKIHIKTKHLNEKLDYKCDSCEYGTNIKSHLNRHIKTKHLMEFDHKCDTCEYRTNHKQHLKVHIKSIHLKEFDYKCDKCELRTNNKADLKRHIKTKHLMQFDYKCDKCEYRTNKKHNIDYHIKTKHLM